jgi:hypothetical protein
MRASSRRFPHACSLISFEHKVVAEQDARRLGTPQEAFEVGQVIGAIIVRY